MTNANDFRVSNLLVIDGISTAVFAWWQGHCVRLYTAADFAKLAEKPDHGGTFVIDWTKNGKTMRVWSRGTDGRFTVRVKNATLEKAEVQIAS